MKRLFSPDFLNPFDPEIRRTLEELRRLLGEEYGGELRIVGGAVRDRLLGREVKDLDLEIYGLSPERFEEAMERLGAKGVGKSFFVYKWRGVDIALPRIERKVGPGHRGFAVRPVEDPREASRRRDFTVNALIYDLRSREVWDYWGGLKDLERRRLRCVDGETFPEDSLRVLRAMRFAAQLAFRVEASTCRLCREISLEDLPGSRIFGEFERMFLSETLHYGLYELLRLKIAERLWGEAMNRASFFVAARALIRFRRSALESLRPWCFLEAYRRYSHVPVEKILAAIDAPRSWRRAFEGLPAVPREPMPRFVAAQAQKAGLRESPLGCDPKIRFWAQKLGVWDRPFEIGVTPRELMERGFAGKALGEELERIRHERLDQLEEKPS